MVAASSQPNGVAGFDTLGANRDPQLPRERREVAGFDGPLQPCGGKITVGAAAGAERQMHVKCSGGSASER